MLKLKQRDWIAISAILSIVVILVILWATNVIGTSNDPVTEPTEVVEDEGEAAS